MTLLLKDIDTNFKCDNQEVQNAMSFLKDTIIEEPYTRGPDNKQEVDSKNHKQEPKFTSSKAFILAVVITVIFFFFLTATCQSLLINYISYCNNDSVCILVKLVLFFIITYILIRLFKLT